MAVETPLHPPGSHTATDRRVPPAHPVLGQTTRRGLATAAFALGLWGTLVFWWYPFGMAITGMALIFGLISLAMGVRGGKDGENLALYGVGLALTGQGLAWTSYRFMMLAFEGQAGWSWLPFKLNG